MSTFIYLHADNKSASQNMTELQAYLKTNALDTPKNLSSLSEISQLKSSDLVITYDAISAGTSLSDTLQFLQECLAVSANAHFVKYNLIFTGQAQSNLTNLIQLIRRIESDFISLRNQAAISRRQEYGIILGRPKGRKNKSLKLDKFKKEIMRYLELSISKASIAKLVDCHPQTLYDWIERNQDETDHFDTSKKDSVSA